MRTGIGIRGRRHRSFRDSRGWISVAAAPPQPPAVLRQRGSSHQRHEASCPGQQRDPETTYEHRSHLVPGGRHLQAHGAAAGVDCGHDRDAVAGGNQQLGALPDVQGSAAREAAGCSTGAQTRGDAGEDEVLQPG